MSDHRITRNNGRGTIASRTEAARRRPNRRERRRIREYKAPLAIRAAKATEMAGETVASAVASAAAAPMDAVHALAHEHVHARGHLLKLIEDLTDSGLLDAKDHWKNLKRGAAHIMGHYFNLNDVTAVFGMIKGMRLGVMREKVAAAAGSGLGSITDTLFPKYTPALSIVGARYVNGDEERKVQERDVFAFPPFFGASSATIPSTNTEGLQSYVNYTSPSYSNLPTMFAQDMRENNLSWPIDSIVFVGAQQHPVVDWRDGLKVAGSVALWVQENGFLKLASLFTEALGGVVGLGEGFDWAFKR